MISELIRQASRSHRYFFAGKIYKKYLLFPPCYFDTDEDEHGVRNQSLARTGHLRSDRRRRPRCSESARFAFSEGYAAVRTAGGPHGTPYIDRRKSSCDDIYMKGLRWVGRILLLREPASASKRRPSKTTTLEPTMLLRESGVCD